MSEPSDTVSPNAFSARSQRSVCALRLTHCGSLRHARICATSAACGSESSPALPPTTCGWVSSSSSIVTCTEDALPAATPRGSAPSATVNVSSSVSSSWAVEIVPETLEKPAGIVMPASVPWSPASDVSRVSVSGIVTSLDSTDASVAVTVTAEPSATGSGAAESDTATALSISRSACGTSTQRVQPLLA